MDFLKDILGEELFNQMAEKINEYNGKEDNKEHQVKIGNLGTGDYISKEKHNAIVEQLAGKETELKTANGLIEQMKKATKDDTELQGKIETYEKDIQTLQQQLNETKLKSAVKVALLSEKATDIDYLTYKLKEKGENLELDENDNIKGWEEKISSLKTQFPAMFETQAGEKKIFGDNRLPEGDGDRKPEPKSLAEALQMQYENTN